MLQFKLTRYHAGIEIWGDIWTLQQVHELLHKINERSPIIENKEGFFLSLAYDLRKAYEGQRKTDTRRLFEDSCRVYGVPILWPLLIAQVGLLRASMSFIPTTRYDQAIAYEFEGLIETAAKEALPGREEEIMNIMLQIGANQSYVETVINSRCAYFIELSPKKRLEMLPEILKSIDRMWDFMSRKDITRNETLSPATFEKYGDDFEWPDFKW